MRSRGLTTAKVVADFVRRRLPPQKKRNWAAWTYTDVNVIGRTHFGPNSVLSDVVVLNVVKKILVDDCGSLAPPEGVAPLAEDRIRLEILHYLPLCDSKGVCQGSSGTIQIGQPTRTTGEDFLNRSPEKCCNYFPVFPPAPFGVTFLVCRPVLLRTTFMHL
ncbi:hypothetical protein ACQJBY_068293 [Aegilops geniculata]